MVEYSNSEKIMIHLSYAGPKPMISHSGITFDKKKADKYRYIPFAVELLKSLDHDYGKDDAYVYQPQRLHDSDEALVETLRGFCPDIEKEVEKWKAKKTVELDAEVDAVRSRETLSGIERTALVNNLRLMYDYRLQRAVNKSFYYAAVAALVMTIGTKRIRYIKTPFHRNYFHVFHTIEGMIRKLKKPIDTKLNLYEESGTLMMRLDLASR